MSVSAMPDHDGLNEPATTPMTMDAIVDVRLRRSRDAMIRAVDGLIAEGVGLESMSVTDVVRRAGVSRPTFYKQFADVAELLRASAMTRMTAMLERAVQQRSDASWSEFMTHTFSQLLTELISDSPYYLTALEASPELLSREMTGLIADRLLCHSPLAEELQRRPGPVTPRQRAEFLAAGTVWQARSWLQSRRWAELTPQQLDEAVQLEMTVLATLLLDAAGVDLDVAEPTVRDNR